MGSHSGLSKLGTGPGRKPTKVSDDVPAIYKGDLNTQRIAAYRRLAEEYKIDEVSVGKIFSAGAEWAWAELSAKIVNSIPRVFLPSENGGPSSGNPSAGKEGKSE